MVRKIRQFISHLYCKQGKAAIEKSQKPQEKQKVGFVEQTQ